MIPTLVAVTQQLTPTPFAWRPHPDVWLMIVSLGLMYLYVTRVLGPKAVPKGTPVITRRQSRFFFAGLFVLWIAVDWPVHDIAEDYLYSVHMLQHLLLTWVVPPMMLLATPEWLARLVLGNGRVYRAFRTMTLPLVAGLLYNTLFALSHAPWIVNESVDIAGFHFMAHTVIVTSAFLMWTCVCGPLPELRRSPPVQCIYLFLMSVLPTIPGAWLVFAKSTVYHVYDHAWPELWGLTPQYDQQMAGFIMKVVGGMYLWGVIFVIYFRWSRTLDDGGATGEERDRMLAVAAERRAKANAVVAQGGLPADDGDVLTYAEVREAFDKTPPSDHPTPT